MSFLDYLEAHELAVNDMLDETVDNLHIADDVEIFVDEEDNVVLWVLKYQVEDVETYYGGALKGLADEILTGEVIDEFRIENPDSLELTLEYIQSLY